MLGTKESPTPTGWFREVFGFDEEQVAGTKHVEYFGRERQFKRFEESKQEFDWKGDDADGTLVSKANGKKFHVGPFEAPTLSNLQNRFHAERANAQSAFWGAGDLRFEHIVGCVRDLHRNPENSGALFQVASLFNCLVCPPGKERIDGVTRYASEATQGPACSVMCPGALVFRTYFADDIDFLSSAGDLVQNSTEGYWAMHSGYCLEKVAGSITRLTTRMRSESDLTEKIRDQVKVGIHWDTEVWGADHHVCQLHCSALPISLYKGARSADWEIFARALLCAGFDATLTAAAILAARRGQRVRVFLTSLGGGTLGNRRTWIADAISKAIEKHANEPLDVKLVHFAELPEDSDFLDIARVAGGFETTSAEMSTPFGRAPRVSPENIQDLLEKMSMEVEAAGQISAEGMTLQRFASDGCWLTGKDIEKAAAWNRENATRVTQAFQAMDANGDGVLDSREFKRALRTLNPQLFTETAVSILMQEADLDSDGVVQYLEFFAWLFKEDQLVSGQVLAFAD